MIQKAGVSSFSGVVPVLHCHCMCRKWLIVTADHRLFPIFPRGKGTGGDSFLPGQLSPPTESETRSLLPQTSHVTCWGHRLALQCLHVTPIHGNARKKDSRQVMRKKEEACVVCILEAKSVLEVLAQSTSGATDCLLACFLVESTF